MEKEEGLKEKTIGGVAWSTAQYAATYAVKFVVAIVLARLLCPDDYGIIGLMMIFISIADCITISGFFNSLVQKKTVDEDDYNTMFFSNMASSIFFYLVIFFASPYIADFFDKPQMTSLLRVEATALFISAFALVQKARLNRQLDFKTPAKVYVTSSIVSGVAGIVMALCGFGVWSLVLSMLLGTLLSTIMFCVCSKWMPRFRFSSRSFKSLFGYGWKVLVAELLNTVFLQAYQFVVGKCYSPATLGQYTRAQGFSELISNNVYNVTRDVTFPVLSKLQSEKDRAREAFRRVIRMLMFVSAILLFGMAAVAKPMVLVLIGEQWLPCVFFLQIICLGSILYPINATNTNLLKSQGRSDIFLLVAILRRVLEIGPICLGIFIDIKWMVIGSVVTNWLSFFLCAHFAGKTIGYSVWSQFKDLLPSLVIASVMAVPVWSISLIPIEMPMIVTLLVQILAGFGIVFALCSLTHNKEYEEVKSIVLKRLGKSQTTQNTSDDK